MTQDGRLALGIAALCVIEFVSPPFERLNTVAQKTVQVFACFGKIVLVQNADIIQGPDFFCHKKYNIIAFQNILDHVI